MLCSNCNTQNPEGSQFCMACGQRLVAPDEGAPKPPESGSETVQLPESDLPPVSAPPPYIPPPPYMPPAAPAGSPPPDYTPPAYTPPAYTAPGYTASGYTPPGYSPPGFEPKAASRWQKVRASRWFKVAGGGVLLLLLLVIGGLLLTRFAPSLLPKGREIFLAMPQRSGEADLYMVKLGQELDQGILLIEDAQQPESGDIWFSYAISNPASRMINLALTGYGGFVPNSNRLFYWYVDRNRVYVEEMRTNDDASTEIIKTDALPLYGLLFSKTEELFLQETRSDQERCYVANPRQAAERLTKGDGCWATLDGSYVWAEERDGDELSLTLLQMNGAGDPVIVLDDQAEVGRYSIARDGSHVAYPQNNRDGWQLFLFATNESTAVEVGQPGVNIPQFGFMGATDTLFYILENDDGVLQLFLSSSETPVAEGVGLAAISSDDGSYLIYMIADEDGEKTVASYNVKTGTNQTILTEENLQFSVISAHNAVLLQVQDGDDLSFYRADIDGANVELLFEDDLALRSLQYALDQDRLYILVSEEDGYDSLFTTSLNAADGFYLVEDWYEIVLLNRSVNGRSLVLTAQEDPGDDYILYSIDLEKNASLVKLDDQYEYYVNAVFTANSRDVVYTGVSGGRVDDVEVLQVPANGDKEPEVLYKEARLLDVRWDMLTPFQFVGYTQLYEAVSFCPGAKTLVVGDSERNSLPADGTRCYRYRGQQEESVTFDVDSPENESYDFTLALHDRDGNRLNFNDDDEISLDPRLTVLLPATDSYFLIVGGNGRATNPEFTLSVLAGVGEPDIVDAAQLIPNNRIRAVIEEGSTVYIQRYAADFHGHFYYLDAKSNERITLNAHASSIGSDLDPQIYLFDQMMEFVDSDDDGGTGYDSRLVFIPRDNGRYYVLITSSSGNAYGNNHFYEVELTTP
jgi:hypothetical protein